MGRIPRDLPGPGVFETHDVERPASVYVVSEARSDVEEGRGEEWCGEDHQCELEARAGGVVCPERTGVNDVACVQIGSINGEIPPAMETYAYSSSKAALHQ